MSSFLFWTVLIVCVVVMWKRHNNKRTRHDDVYDATVAQLQADAHRMAIIRRDPRTGKLDQ